MMNLCTMMVACLRELWGAAVVCEILASVLARDGVLFVYRMCLHAVVSLLLCGCCGIVITAASSKLTDARLILCVQRRAAGVGTECV